MSRPSRRPCRSTVTSAHFPNVDNLFMSLQPEDDTVSCLAVDYPQVIPRFFKCFYLLVGLNAPRAIMPTICVALLQSSEFACHIVSIGVRFVTRYQ